MKPKILVIDGVIEIRQYQPDAILLDLGLPDRASFVLLERLKQNRFLSTIPVIVMAVQDSQVTEQPAKEHGAVAFLQKPLKVDELIPTIRKTLHQKE